MVGIFIEGPSGAIEGKCIKKGCAALAQPIDFMAEREGFEPSIQFYPYTRLAGERLRPSRPPLRGNDVNASFRGFF